VKRIVLLTTLAVLAATGTAVAGANGPSATGGSHLVAHDVFGLQTLELQNFGFNATTKADGSADGWFTYRDVEDGTPFSADGPVTCLTVIGRDAWIGGGIRNRRRPRSVVARHRQRRGRERPARHHDVPRHRLARGDAGVLRQPSGVSLPLRDRRREHPGAA